MNTSGRHLLMEFYGCDPALLNDKERIENLLGEAAAATGAKVMASFIQPFEPQGVTGVLVLAESHLSIHTWPEEGYAAVDLFTCATQNTPQKAFQLLSSSLGASHGEVLTIRRGAGPDASMGLIRHQQGGQGRDLNRPQASVFATPSHHALVTSSAESSSPLNAFDRALLTAGVGDMNLVRVSSILPPDCQRTDPETLAPPFGALIPVAYAHIGSERGGEVIAAAIAIGLPEDPALPGLIMEHEGHAPLHTIEAQVRQMVVDGMKTRGRAVREIQSTGSEHTVERCGAVFAGVVLWS